MKRKKLIGVAVSVVGLIVAYGGVLVLFSDPSVLNRPADYADGQGQELPEFAVDPGEQLDRFEKWAQYPPHSRPLDAEMVDLVRPYDGVAPPESVLVGNQGDCEETERGLRFNCTVPPERSAIECTLTPERSISTGLSEHKILLHCYRPSQFFADVDVPVTSIEAWISLRRLAEPDSVSATVTYGDDGQNGDETAGDDVYTFGSSHECMQGE